MKAKLWKIDKRMSGHKANLSRMMFPSHANIAGNVHGGTIMKIIDEAASVAALRFYNYSDQKESKNNRDSLLVALARVDSVSFKAPMYVGELCKASACVTFSSSRSIQIYSEVVAENLVTGESRVTNTARLWYVPVTDISTEVMKVQDYQMSERVKITVPKVNRQLEYTSKEEEKLGYKRYLEQKRVRQSSISQSCAGTPTGSTLAQVMLPDDCNHLGNVQGGVILKLIDNAAGIIALRHARSNVVTAKMEALDFINCITIGQLVELKAQLVYTSRKSMDIKVDVYAESPRSGDKYLAATSNLVFVALDEAKKTMEVDQMEKPKDEFLLEQYMAAKHRHELRKKH